jgi:hypothetical protein
MRALVVYESMYGNTNTIAERIAEGLRASFDVTVVASEDAAVQDVSGADLVVCGGPTHVHTMATKRSRQAAATAAEKPDSGLQLEPHAGGIGVREWLAGIGPHTGTAAAFDTRLTGPAWFTGRAGRAIGRRLRRAGFRLAVKPESFLVDKRNHLVQGEADRAAAWGAALATEASRLGLRA